MRGLFFFLLLTLVFSATAQDRTYNIYVDKDNNPATGCVVPQPDFATQFDGVDGYISITTTTSPVVITDSLYHVCNGGSFDAGSPFVNSALGLNTNTNGDDVFEAEMNTSDMGIRSTANPRLYFSTESVLSSDIATVNNSGNGIYVGVAFPIPSLSIISLLLLGFIVLVVSRKVLKKKTIVLASVMLFSTAVWAMFVFVIDGETGDWSSFTPINDPIGDTSTPANFSDITQVFANLEQDKFTARMDVVDVENQAPTITSANAVSVPENQTAAIDVESTDVDGDVEGAGLTYAFTGGVDDALFSLDVNTGIVTFLTAPDFEVPGDDNGDNDYEIQVTVTDSGGLTDVQNIVVTVTNVNEPPVAQADALTATTNIVNNYALGVLFADNGSGADDLGDPASTLVSFGGGSLGGAVTDNPAGFTTAFAGGNLTVTADGSLSITNPTTAGTFTFDYRIQNVAGFSDATVTVTIQSPPSSQNDSYSFLTNADQNVSAGTGLFVDNGSGADDLGSPSATLISFGGGNSGGTVTTYSPGSTVAFAGGTLTVNADGSWSLTGQPFTAGTYTFEYRIDNGVGTSDSTVTFNISEPNLPPVAMNDAYDSIGNVGITVPAVSGILINDSDPDMDPVVLVSHDTFSAQGGLVNVSLDGSFTYSPPVGYSGPDSFTYTISDGLLSSVGTVNLTVPNRIWFVDGNAAAGGNGSLIAPFVNTSDFMSTAVDGSGDCIFVKYAGGFNYSSVITLLDNQKLVGEGSTTGLATECGITVPPFSNALPATGGTNPILIGATGINVASGNTIRGFTIVNAHQKIVGSNFGTLKIREVGLVQNGEAVNLDTGIADIVFDFVQSMSSPGFGIRLNNVSGVFTVTGATTVDSVTEEGILIENSNLAYTFGNVLVIGRQKAGVVINAITGGVQTGEFGVVTIINSGSGNNTTGLAIDNIITPGSTINIASAIITNQGSNSSAVALSNNDGATITINGGSVSNTSGASVSVSSGSGVVNFAATISNTAGRAVQILNNDGGTINFTGHINSSGSSSAEGIYADANTGAEINFTGPLSLFLSTNDAFTAINGGTLTVTGTGNIITTTSGTAINIQNTTIGAAGVTFQSVSSTGGAVNGIVLANTGNIGPFEVLGNSASINPGVRGTLGSFTGGNIQFTTGDAIVLNNVSNVTFKSMQLNNGLGDGISAAGVNNLTLENMSIINTGVHGIDGANVTGLSITNSDFNTNGDANGENALNFITPPQALTGTVTILDSKIEAFSDSGMIVRNTSGSLSMTIDNTLFAGSYPGGVNEADGLRLDSYGSATMTVLVENSDFTGIYNGGILAWAGQQMANDTSILNLTVDNNSFTNSSDGGVMVEFLAVSNAISSVSVLNSNFEPVGNQSGLGISRAYTSSLHATLRGNVISRNDIFLNTAPGIYFIHDQFGTGTSYVSMDGNQISGYEAAGIDIYARDPSGGSSHVTVINNTITPAPATISWGMAVTSDDSSDVLAKIHSNTVNAGYIYGIFIVNSNYPSSSFALQGIMGATAVDAINYLSANNALGNPPFAIGTFIDNSPTLPTPTPLP